MATVSRLRVALLLPRRFPRGSSARFTAGLCHITKGVRITQVCMLLGEPLGRPLWAASLRLFLPSPNPELTHRGLGKVNPLVLVVDHDLLEQPEFPAAGAEVGLQGPLLQILAT